MDEIFGLPRPSPDQVLLFKTVIGVVLFVLVCRALWRIGSKK